MNSEYFNIPDDEAPAADQAAEGAVSEAAEGEEAQQGGRLNGLTFVYSRKVGHFKKPPEAWGKFRSM
ncbi:MAG: hypothetical protein PW734_10510 [Verrucomicrobium sp.]|nr:hypothetical protein [Verrucomicrobium sp.]